MNKTTLLINVTTAKLILKSRKVKWRFIVEKDLVRLQSSELLLI